ncbi:MAG: T9SS type A sorting domain-containing protein [Bacteroidia bacterium]|nr:T9SS type A sorting domain-containing protein [Bacteroidia bacterium]
MKNRTIVLLFTIALSAFTRLSAQCTPDTTLTTVGLSPDTLPVAYIGQAYNQVLFAALPKDTAIFPGVSLAFCSYRIDSIKPNPASFGLSYACDQPGCQYTVNHQDTADLQFGCLTITGTPTLELDSIQVYISAQAGTYNPATNTCTVSLTLPLVRSVAFQIRDTSSTSSRDAELRSQLQVRLRPNPAAGSSQLSFRLAAAAQTQAVLLDPTGRQIAVLHRGLLGAGEHQFSTPAGLAAGLYLVRISLPQGDVTEKLLIAR